MDLHGWSDRRGERAPRKRAKEEDEADQDAKKGTGVYNCKYTMQRLSSCVLSNVTFKCPQCNLRSWQTCDGRMQRQAAILQCWRFRAQPQR